MFEIPVTASGTGPLCPQLHRRLQRVFGKVTISKPRQPFRGRLQRNGLSKYETAIDSWGEAYCVNCPYCEDTKQHLWINHTYGQPDVNGPRIGVVKCFRRDCLSVAGRKVHLSQIIMGGGNWRVRAPFAIEQVAEEADGGLDAVSPPGETISLLHMPAEHPAVQFLTGEKRRYTQQMIADNHIGYVVAAHTDYPMAQGRLYYPIIMDDTLVGWQCRYPSDDIKRMKYYSLPGMKKSRMLYGFDAAKEQNFVVVMEGPPKVHRLGRHGVGVMGGSVSPQQRQLLLRHWPGKPIVVMLDPGKQPGDAGATVAQREAVAALTPQHSGPVIPVWLPTGPAPDDYDHSVIWQIVFAAARDVNVDLASIF